MFNFLLTKLFLEQTKSHKILYIIDMKTTFYRTEQNKGINVNELNTVLKAATGLYKPVGGAGASF